MKRLTSRLATASALAALMAAGAPALASSHREAPAVLQMPQVDGTDFSMFRSYEPGREGYVTLIANYIPLQGPGDGPNYFPMDEDAVYEIMVDNDGDAVEDITFQFKFNNNLRDGTGLTLDIDGVTQPIPLRFAGPIARRGDANLGENESYSVNVISGDRRTGSSTPLTSTSNQATSFFKTLDNVGNKTIPDYEAYAAPFMYMATFGGCSTPSRVFVGQRAEAFAVNLGESFDLVNYVPIEGDSAPGAGDGGGFPGGITQDRANDDLVGKKNVTSIAIEVPIECLTGDGNGVIGAWTTASLPQARMLSANPTYEDPSVQSGAFVQVSRLSNPLVNEVVIGLPQKDLFNAAEPTQDGALASYVTNPTFPAILNLLFRDPVNATLGASIPDLAPSNFPRADLVAAFLTGIETLNQQATVTPSEMIRLNTAIPPTPREQQSPFGVAGDDLAGFPNGRRPGDDVVDIALRVVMGRLCYPVPINGAPTDLGLCDEDDAPVGNVAFTDGAPLSAMDVQNAFPYLNTPIPGSPREAREDRETTGQGRP